MHTQLGKCIKFSLKITKSEISKSLNRYSAFFGSVASVFLAFE